ncbi:hypothetical protein ANCCEY_08507 [Ancylostoma ceylanicum]|uniref:Uncharacterized protein n=1 Tax=Ancylostoma ceylanicum TaxID=53326 RepID=A0A0D6LK05_9BILA|nr:hypothetical protein ANCCEY_08507 [Ancylostoma ceylanicum]
MGRLAYQLPAIVGALCLLIPLATCHKLVVNPVMISITCFGAVFDQKDYANKRTGRTEAQRYASQAHRRRVRANEAAKKIIIDDVRGFSLKNILLQRCRFLKRDLFGYAAQTPEPEWAPTGKLNQFRGFVTPRPLPPNAEFVYASVWAAWSAWSFCSNGVRIRVRACNTVRGFNCLGPNKEFTPCDPSLRHSHRNPSAPSDYDVVDPYEADRREAMRQLYPDDFPAAEEKKNPNFVKLSKPESGGFRVHAAGPISESSVIDITKASGVPTVDADSLAVGPQVSSVDSSKEVFKWVENPEYDWSAVDGVQNEAGSSGSAVARVEPIVGPEPVASTSPVPSILLATEKVDANEEQVFIAITTPKYVYPWLEDPLFDDNLAKGVYGRERTPISLSDFHKNHHHASRSPAYPDEGHMYGPPGPRQFAVKTVPGDKDAEQEVKDPQDAAQFQLHREEVEAALNSLHIRDEGRSGQEVPREQPDIRVWDPSELIEPEKKTRGSSDFSRWKHVQDFSKDSLSGTKDVVLREKSEGTTLQEVHEQVTEDKVAEVAEKQTEAPVTEQTTTPDLPTTTPALAESTTTSPVPVLEDEDHFEEFGTRPQVVQPTLNKNDIDEDLMPELVVPVETLPPATTQTSTEPPTTTEPTTTTPSTTTTARSTTSEEIFTTLVNELTQAQKDIIDERTLLEPTNSLSYKMNKAYKGLSKAVPESAIKKKKMKGFGITGIFFRKNHKKSAIHEGDVTSRTNHPTTIRTTTARPTTTSTTTREPIIEEDPQELSQDTLHALDWMLQNITKIAERGDEAFMKALQINSDDRTNFVETQESSNTEPTELAVSLATIKRPNQKKSGKPKKVKKGRRKGLSKKRKTMKPRDAVLRVHSGEFKPVQVDKKKMFPKFKSTITMANRARSFGVRTVNEDKDENKWDQTVVEEALEAASQKHVEKKESATTEDPVRLMEEIKTLQSLMDDMEQRVHNVTANKTTEEKKSEAKAPSGNSYESRSCTGGWCPVPTETTRPEVTTTKMPQVPPEKPSDPLRHFRPLQLHTATSRECRNL